MPGTNGNAAAYFVDRHREGPVAAKAAFIEAGPGGRTITYQDLALQTDRMAALYERHGLRAEDRAAMLVLDLIEFPIIFWGSMKAGIVPIPLNTLLPAEVYNAILMDSRVRALFVSAELLPTVAPILAGNPYLQAVFVIDRGKAGAAASSSFLGPVLRRQRQAGQWRQDPRLCRGACRVRGAPNAYDERG